ncbi:putative C6 transcription factor [Aspergillus nidulans FGSC A4]|uniref:Zn(II)2Cys6 transcription factor (Eurofung) n=1 Tax=Emericella nidulans (strain FGSC A4 / ATCC 38163 / CBS 112.46 / NRRL 194 / M139) TaxID=227321 RepID=C8VEQ2_EMENI|nr:hypothetical protein [Aspergillus nidulans FGSC A4]CBF80748.1 TPA: Putative Zn(II)2Cys6 transcription factor (Eurofung) [Aspergillus nidulans FGSC A4]
MPNPKSRRLVPVVSDTISLPVQKRRKNVGTACSSCKARKLKCTGAPPCANCLKSRLECTLDETADKRRRGVLKRKIDKLEDKEDLLVRLLEFFRESSNRSTIPLLNLIRSHASPAEIRFYIEQQPNLPQTPELLEVELPQRHILDARKSSDAPRFSVPARPWTSIIDDDDLVSRLISSWFTWVHPICNFIDRDLFIRDMQSGSLSASYCSPLLVNIILSDACAYSSDNLSDLRTNFYTEAKRLLDKEEGRISLPTVQALSVLWMCNSATNIGRDRQAWIIGGQLAYSLRELLASCNSPPDYVNHTNWGIFNLSLAHALLVRKFPAIPPPSQPPPSNQCKNHTWCSQSDAHTFCLFNAVCELNRTAYNLGQALFTPLLHLDLSSKKLDALQYLGEWLDQLPICLNERNVDIPHVLSLHMHYHTIMSAVYGLFRFQSVDPSTHPLSPNIREALRSPAYAFDGCLSSACKVAQLTLVHRSRWGADRMPAINVPYIITALFNLLEVIDDPINRDAFISLVVATGAFSQRSPVTKGYMRTLQNMALERKISLPAETGPFFLNSDS